MRQVRPARSLAPGQWRSVSCGDAETLICIFRQYSASGHPTTHPASHPLLPDYLSHTSLHSQTHTFPIKSLVSRSAKLLAAAPRRIPRRPGPLCGATPASLFTRVEILPQSTDAVPHAPESITTFHHPSRTPAAPHPPPKPVWLRVSKPRQATLPHLGFAMSCKVAPFRELAPHQSVGRSR